MNFQLLSWPVVLIGCGVLAGVLFLIQRLRVQHREVEVQTTLFWQAALEETRARVFVKRFRHWKPWLLLVAIASLLWFLFAGPQRSSFDGTQHIVLLDWSIDEEELRETDLQIAIEFAEALPANAREIVSVGTQLQTLLRPNEDVNVARLRSSDVAAGQSQGMDWGIEKLSERASDSQRVEIYVVGDSVIDQRRLPTLLTTSEGGEPRLSIARLARKEETKNAAGLKTLGVSESVSGAWDRVDVWLDVVIEGDVKLEAERIAITSNNEPISQQLIVGENVPFEVRDLPTDGSTLDVDVDGERIGSITLPKRSRIRVRFEGDVPGVVRELVELDPACEIVPSGADVIVGSGPTADFRLVSDETVQSAAFAIKTDAADDVQTAMSQIVDELALRQVDATSLAEQSGETIQVDVEAGDKRGVAMWQSLFGPAFDFRESRACPIVVSRTIRWLANTPPIVEWVAVGERLPVSAPLLRAPVGSVDVSDGRSIATSRLVHETAEPAVFREEASGGLTLGLNPFTLLGLLVVVLLSLEWAMYQRGHMP